MNMNFYLYIYIYIKRNHNPRTWNNGCKHVIITHCQLESDEGPTTLCIQLWAFYKVDFSHGNLTLQSLLQDVNFDWKLNEERITNRYHGLLSSSSVLLFDSIWVFLTIKDFKNIWLLGLAMWRPTYFVSAWIQWSCSQPLLPLVFVR